jgi:hypothetical protein
MSPVGSNMRPGSSVLSTKAVSTTSDGDVEADDPPLPLLPPLLPQAAKPATTARTHPDASGRRSRMGHPLIVAVLWGIGRA